MKNNYFDENGKLANGLILIVINRVYTMCMYNFQIDFKAAGNMKRKNGLLALNFNIKIEFQIAHELKRKQK